MRKLTRSRSNLSAGSFDLSKEDRIQVAIRARPLLAKESGNKIIWKFSARSVEELKDDGAILTGKRFSYDHVFGPGVSTPNVYEALCREIVEGVLEGYNGTIFTYGQTSSGKTFTMVGSSSNSPGVSILAFDDAFRTIQYQGPYEWTVHASYLEIYNETITDLLQVRQTPRGAEDPASGRNFKIYDDKRFGPCVKNLTEVKAKSSQDCVSLLNMGEKNRHYAATGMNDTSSRSHTIFQMRIASKSLGGLEQDESLQKMRTVASEFAGMQQQIEAEHATLYIVDQEHQELHSHAGDGVVNIPISQGLAGACALDGRTLNIDDVHSDSRFNPEYDERTGYSCHNTLIVPIKSDIGEILAVAQFINKKHSPDDARWWFTNDDEAKAESFAECISPLIQACKSNVRVSRVGVLNLVDLAGSERIRKSASTGSALKEACFINKSLSTLGSCINILAEGKQQHVPFRDSKLTILLSGSLGGNARTAIICAVSPATRNRSETMSTLQFANRAKRIINKVQQNTRRDQSELVHLYMTETDKLREELGHMKVVNKWQVAALKASLDIQKKRHSAMIESSFRMSDEIRLQLSKLKNSCSEAETAANVLTRMGAPRVQLHPLVTAHGDDMDEVKLLIEVKREGFPETWISEEELQTRLDILTQIQVSSLGTVDVDVWDASAKQGKMHPPVERALDSETEVKDPARNSSQAPASYGLQQDREQPFLEPKASLNKASLFDICDSSTASAQSLAQKLLKREEPTVGDIQRLRVELAAVMKNLEQLSVELDALENQKRKEEASTSASTAVLHGAILTSIESSKASSEGGNDFQLAKLHSLLQKASSLMRNRSRSTSRTSRRSDDKSTARSPDCHVIQGARQSISPPRRTHAPSGMFLGRCAGASPPRVRQSMPCVSSLLTSPSPPSVAWGQAGSKSSIAPLSTTTITGTVATAVPQRSRALSASSARRSTVTRTMTPVRYMQDSTVSRSRLQEAITAAAPVACPTLQNDARQVAPVPTHERSRARTAASGSVRDDSSRASSRQLHSEDIDPVDGEFVSQLRCLKRELDSTLEHMKIKESPKRHPAQTI